MAAATSKARRGKSAGKKNAAKGKAAPKGKAAKAAKTNGGEKLSIAEKRLSHASLGDRRKAVKMAQAGDSVKEISEFLGVPIVKAKFLVMQQQVEDGKVPRVNPNKEADIVKALKADNDFNSVAWVACRTGLSGGKVTDIAKSAGIQFDRGRPAGEEKVASKRGKGKKAATKPASKRASKATAESTTKARRGGKVGKKASKSRRGVKGKGKTVDPNA